MIFLQKINLDFQTSFGIALIIHMISAYLSEGFYHYDEHFQVLEFMGYKLGMINLDQLPWEFKSASRSFAQPFLYYLIIKPLSITDPFLIAFICRFLSSILGCSAFYYFLKPTLQSFAKNIQDKILLIIPFLFFLPFFQSRTSSENLSSIAILFSCGLLLRTKRPKFLQTLFISILAMTGFIFRYQSGFLLFGMFAWAWAYKNFRWKELFIAGLGAIFVLAVEAMINNWGYDLWAFVPWNYFDYQVLQGMAAKFGKSPWYFFPIDLRNQFGPIAAIIIFFAFLRSIFQFPKSLGVWMSIPFVFVHCLVSHKEIRFLFPAAVLLIPVMLASIIQFVDRAKKFRRTIYTTLILINFILLFGWSFFPAKDLIFIAHRIIDHGNPNSKIYCVGEDYLHVQPVDVNFYKTTTVPHCEKKTLTTMLDDMPDIIYIRYNDPSDYLNSSIPKGFKVVSEDSSIKLVKSLSGIVSADIQNKLLKYTPLRVTLFKN